MFTDSALKVLNDDTNKTLFNISSNDIKPLETQSNIQNTWFLPPSQGPDPTTSLLCLFNTRCPRVSVTLDVLRVPPETGKHSIPDI